MHSDPTREQIDGSLIIAGSYQTQIRIDAADRPHIAYHDDSNNYLMHAFRSSNGAVWDITKPCILCVGNPPFFFRHPTSHVVWGRYETLHLLLFGT